MAAEAFNEGSPPIEDAWLTVFWSGQGFPGYPVNTVENVMGRLRGTVMFINAISERNLKN
jgi:hypothetical protein